MKDSAPRAKLVMDDDDEKPNLFDDNQVKVSVSCKYIYFKMQ